MQSARNSSLLFVSFPQPLNHESQCIQFCTFGLVVPGARPESLDTLFAFAFGFFGSQFLFSLRNQCPWYWVIRLKRETYWLPSQHRVVGPQSFNDFWGAVGGFRPGPPYPGDNQFNAFLLVTCSFQLLKFLSILLFPKLGQHPRQVLRAMHMLGGVSAAKLTNRARLRNPFEKKCFSVMF